jgi:hypothetical protein
MQNSCLEGEVVFGVRKFNSRITERSSGSLDLPALVHSLPLEVLLQLQKGWKVSRHEESPEEPGQAHRPISQQVTCCQNPMIEILTKVIFSIYRALRN